MTTTNQQLISRVISRKGGDRIGSYLWWSLRDVEVTRNKLRRLFTRAGLDHAYLPAPIVGHAAFRKAIAACKHGDRGLLLRPITETPQEIIYGVVREDVDEGAEDLAYRVRAKIVYRKRTETCVVRGGASPVAREVRRLFADYKTTYIHIDIRRWIIKLVHDQMNALTLKSNGGVYFIPDLYTGILTKVGAIVDGLPGQSRFTITPIFDSKETTANLGPATQDALAEELATIQEEIEAFKEKPPRRDTLRRRLDEFTALKGRAQLYADMLQFTADDLIEGITDLDTVVGGLIGKVEADVRRKVEDRKLKRRKDYRKPARIVRKVVTND